MCYLNHIKSGSFHTSKRLVYQNPRPGRVPDASLSESPEVQRPEKLAILKQLLDTTTPAKFDDTLDDVLGCLPRIIAGFARDRIEDDYADMSPSEKLAMLRRNFANADDDEQVGMLVDRMSLEKLRKLLPRKAPRPKTSVKKTGEEVLANGLSLLSNFQKSSLDAMDAGLAVTYKDLRARRKEVVQIMTELKAVLQRYGFGHVTDWDNVPKPRYYYFTKDATLILGGDPPSAEAKRQIFELKSKYKEHFTEYNKLFDAYEEAQATREYLASQHEDTKAQLASLSVRV